MGQDANGINVLAGRAATQGRAARRGDWSGHLAVDAATVDPAVAIVPPLASGMAMLHPPPAAPDRPSALPGTPPAADATTFGAAARLLESQALPATTSPAYPVMYVFGGSLADTGNLFAADSGAAPTAPYFDGRFSNGPLWVEDYAHHFDIPAPTAALLGGTNFAYAGSLTGAADLPPTGHDLPQQLAAFIQQNPNPMAGALYVVGSGANDLTAILDTQASIPVLEAMVAESARADVAFIGNLAAHGAVNFLMSNVPDLGKTPIENVNGPQQAANASALTAYYNAVVAALVIPMASADHLNIDVIDTYSLVDQITADPAAYGFTNATDPVWTGNATNPSSGTLAAATLAGQDRYLFWDYLHPTEAGAALIAANAENIVFH